jgi:hypothetical protein
MRAAAKPGSGNAMRCVSALRWKSGSMRALARLIHSDEALVGGSQADRAALARKGCCSRRGLCERAAP